MKSNVFFLKMKKHNHVNGYGIFDYLDLNLYFLKNCLFRFFKHKEYKKY